MISVSHDAAHLFRVWDHPTVKPWVSLGLPELLTLENAEKILALPGVVFLANEHGGFLLIPSEGGIYDLHTQFLPEGRGPQLVEAAQEGARYMFIETPCVVVRTFVPVENKAAASFATRCGFVEVSESEFLGHKGHIYILTLKKWVLCQ